MAASKYFCQESLLGLAFPNPLEYYGSMEELSTTEQVLDALGGNAAVAELTGSKAKAVWNWRGFDTFPSNTYVAMQEALLTKGKTAPASLWGMKQPSDHERVG